MVSVLVAATFTSWLVTPLVIRVAIARGVYDVPSGGRRIHARPVPRLGGIAIFAALVVALLVAWVPTLNSGLVSEPARKLLSGILLGGGLLFVVGLADDLRELRPAVKVAAQVVAALLVYALGLRVEVLSVGSSLELSLGWLALPLTIFWIVGVTNAFNLIDGLDGLASGIALVALATTVTVAAFLGRADVALVAAAVVGALLGFLPYNFSPARIFLGDSGSLLIGFLLAVLSVHGSMKSATAVLVVVPLCALALPLLDTTLAILRRWLRGTPLSGADARHIHHQLVALGLTHRRAVSVLYVFASSLAVLGLSLAFAPPSTVLWIAAAGGSASVVLLLYGVRSLQYHEFFEAGAAALSAARKSRRVIRDRIHAQDVARVIRLAKSREEVTAILQDNASAFGFLHMEVCRESARGHGRDYLKRAGGGRAWRLEYPVVPTDSTDEDPFVLRVWCNLDVEFRPYGAERVAQILGPVIEEKLQWLRPVNVGREPQDTRLVTRAAALSG